MARDLPDAGALVEAAATHLRTRVRPGRRGLAGVEAAAAARLLDAARRGPVAGRKLLLQFVALYLAKRVRPSLRGFAAFESLIAAHLLMVAKRELDLGPATHARVEDALRSLLGEQGSADELEAALVARLRDDARPLDGRERARVLSFLRSAAADRQRIANPDYLRSEVSH